MSVTELLMQIFMAGMESISIITFELSSVSFWLSQLALIDLPFWYHVKVLSVSTSLVGGTSNAK